MRTEATKMSLDLKDFNFPKLGSPNGDPALWFMKMKYLLMGKKLYGAIEQAAAAAAPTASTSSSGEAQAEEGQAVDPATDAQAKAVIALCVQDHLLVTVDKAASAKAATRQALARSNISNSGPRTPASCASGLR